MLMMFLNIKIRNNTVPVSADVTVPVSADVTVPVSADDVSDSSC